MIITIKNELEVLGNRRVRLSIASENCQRAQDAKPHAGHLFHPTRGLDRPCLYCHGYRARNERALTLVGAEQVGKTRFVEAL